MPSPDLLEEGEELVAGRRPVEEAFVARRGARRLLVVPARRQALERLVLHATSLRIPVVEVEGGTLTAVAGFDGHQGIALVVEPRTFASVDDILARAVERGEPPFVLVMDSLEDPQNVGTLLRSAEAAGVHGVIFPTHRQAPLSPAAVKASAGAVEHLLLAPVDDLPGSLSDLRMRGLRIAAAEADAPLTADQADLRGPLAIIVGSEGQGLSPAVRRRADLAIRIPMRGAIGSLNAAVAGSILLFGAVAQRGAGEPRGDGDRAPEASAAGTPPVGAATPDANEGDAAATPGSSDSAVVDLPDPAPDGPTSRKRGTSRRATDTTPAKPSRAGPTRATKGSPTKKRAHAAAPADATPAAATPAVKRARATKRPAPAPAAAVPEAVADASPPPKRARATKARAADQPAPDATPAKPRRTRKPVSGPPVEGTRRDPDDLLPGPSTPSTATPRRTRRTPSTDTGGA